MSSMISLPGRVLAVCVTLLLVLGLASCAAAPRTLEAPTVELVGLSLVSASAESQRFRVSLRVANGNPIALPVERVSFSVRVGGGGVMSGRSTEPFTLAAGGSETVQLEVTTNLVSSVSRLLSLLQGPNDAIGYDLNGLVTLSRGLNPTFPFSARGEIPLSMPAR